MLLAKGVLGAWGINDSGVAVGTIATDDGLGNVTSQPCYWPSSAWNASLIDTTGSSYTAYAINSKGIIAGAKNFGSGVINAALTDQSGKISPLIPLPNGALQYDSVAFGINDSYAIGYSRVDSNNDLQVARATRWLLITLEAYDLGVLNGYTESVAYAISRTTNQIVGFCTDNQHSQAFLWTPEGDKGQMEGLGTLGGNSSVAFGVNDKGSVVGQSTTLSGDTHAFVWRRGTNNGPPSNPQMEDLGTLPGDSYSDAKFIDENGNVFGASGHSYNSPLTACVSELSDYFLYLASSRVYFGAPPSPPPVRLALASTPGKIFRRTRGYGAMQPVLKKLLLPGDFYPASVYGGNSKGQIVGAGTYSGAGSDIVGYRITYIP